MDQKRKLALGQRILERRVVFFAGLSGMSETEIEILSQKWHDLINRYQSFVAMIKIRQFRALGHFVEN